MATDKPIPNFNFDKVLRAETKNEPFRFILDGKPHEMKHINDLDAVDVSGLGRTADVNWRIIKHAASPETYEKLRAQKPTVGQLNAFITAYNDHCGVDAGE